MGLMNLVDHMRVHGPLKNLWEGKNQGEAFVKFVKPLTGDQKKGNWQNVLMTKTVQKKAMEMVLHDLTKGPNENPCSLSEMHCGNVHICKDSSEVTQCFFDRVPMSVVMLNDGMFGAMLVNGQIVQLECGNHVSDVNGSTYHNWELPISDTMEMEDRSPDAIAHYCLLLPLLEETGLPSPHCKPVYTVITSEHLEIKTDKSFGFPEFNV